MDTSFRLLPDQASQHAADVDQATLFLLLVSVFFTLLIATLVVYFAIRYRRRASGEHSPVSAPPERKHAGLALEITWTVIPLVIVAFMFLAGARNFMRSQTPPRDAMEIQVMGKRWMWHVQHPTGAREI